MLYSTVVKHNGRQDGIALISVLLVFFVATLLAVGMIERQQLDIYRTRNHIDQIQLYLSALSAEEAVKTVLAEDFMKDMRESMFKDTFNESWNEPMVLESEYGLTEIEISDLQGLFNVNGLVIDGKKDAAAYAAFVRLLGSLDISQAEEIADAVLAHLEHALPLFNIGGLPGVEKLDEESVSALRNCLAFLPSSSKLNLNTASVVVLGAWSNVIVQNQMEDLLEERQKENGLGRVPSLPGSMSSFSVNSEFFLADIKISLKEQVFYLRSVFYRDGDNGASYLVNRQVNRWLYKPVAGPTACDISSFL